MARIISTIPLELLNIEDNGFHILCSAKLNGKEIRLLVDTGASKTVFDRTRFLMHKEEEDLSSTEELTTGIGTNTMESELAVLDCFEIGSLTLSDYPIVVLDLTHVNESYGMIGKEPIDGVIGGDFLMAYKAVIYYAKKQMKIYHNE